VVRTTTNSSGTAGATDWASLCKLAKTRAARCGISNQTVADCEKLDGCTEHPFDTSAPAVLAKCLADSDCNACAKAATASPSPAGKAYFTAVSTFGKTCDAFKDPDAFIGSVGGLFNADSLKPFLDCTQKPQCIDAMSCAGMASVGMDTEANIQCTQVLGLGASIGDANSVMTEPPPDTTGTEQIGTADDLEAAGSMLAHPAPEIDVKPIGKGKAAKLKNLKGKFVFLHFWRTSGAPCGKSMADLEAFAKAHADKKVVVIGIAIDKDDKGFADYIKKNPTKVPLMWDSAQKTAKTYHLLTMPETVVINPKGNVAAEFTSAVVSDQDYAAVFVDR
jgi:peroxiredoxin